MPKLPGMGAAGIAETSTVGTEKAGVVGTAETGAEGAAGIDTTGVARAVISTPAAIPDPSKVSANREIGVQMKRKYNKKKKGRKKEGEERYIPMKSGSSEALSSSSELEILFFRNGTSLGSSRMSSNPFEDKSVSGPRVIEPGMEEGVTTREAPPFAAWKIAAKGSLVEITSGRTEEAILV